MIYTLYLRLNKTFSLYECDTDILRSIISTRYLIESAVRTISRIQSKEIKVYTIFDNLPELIGFWFSAVYENRMTTPHLVVEQLSKSLKIK